MKNFFLFTISLLANSLFAMQSSKSMLLSPLVTPEKSPVTKEIEARIQEAQSFDREKAKAAKERAQTKQLQEQALLEDYLKEETYAQQEARQTYERLSNQFMFEQKMHRTAKEKTPFNREEPLPSLAISTNQKEQLKMQKNIEEETRFDEFLANFETHNAVYTGPEIHTAVKNGDLERVAALLSQEEVRANEKDSLGKTPLHYASELTNSNALNIVQHLLDHGAKTTIKDATDITPYTLINERFNSLLHTVNTLRRATPFLEEAPAQDHSPSTTVRYASSPYNMRLLLRKEKELEQAKKIKDMIASHYVKDLEGQKASIYKYFSNKKATKKNPNPPEDVSTEKSLTEKSSTEKSQEMIKRSRQ